ncbi:MAG: peptide chain release factor N(5)-glutamine methyltransferase [Candidatus Limimorpha sp.]
MKVPSNLVRDIRRYYSSLLETIYSKEESQSLIMILLQHYFGYDRVKIALHDDLRLSESQLLTFHFAVKELLRNRPVQHIIGEEEFCGMSFTVNENVLIPRPETAEMTEMIASKAAGAETMGILDIGTGSGCIAISLAKMIKGSDVTAIDISDKAIETAKDNAVKNDANVNFIKADILNFKEWLDASWHSKFDIIVSNPPYVCESERNEMRANVTDYEPQTALFVKDDEPLVFYSSILDFAKQTLKPNGVIWFEINEKFGLEIKRLCIEKGFKNTMVVLDFRGKDRFVKAQM